MRSLLLAPIFKLRELNFFSMLRFAHGSSAVTVWKTVSCAQLKSQYCFKSRTTTKEDSLIPSNKFVARLELDLDFCLMIIIARYFFLSYRRKCTVALLFTANVI